MANGGLRYKPPEACGLRKNWTNYPGSLPPFEVSSNFESLFRSGGSFVLFTPRTRLICTREKLDLAALSRRREMDESSQLIIAALKDNRQVFEGITERQTHVMVDLQQEMQRTIVDEHDTTRSVILDAVKEASRAAQDTRKRIARKEVWVNTEKEELEIKRLAEDRILRSLLFPSITARYLQVAKAHVATFEWILKDCGDEDRSWSSFIEWLECGNGIYWINGKAGSGKSTLMKYLYDHHRTRDCLGRWSNAMPLDLAAFFFWNSGTFQQKSQNGLLRSLLHEILSQHRALIPIVLPELWRDEYTNPTEYFQEFHWTLDNMKAAFEVLSTQSHLRICLFIDGLDEYEGDRDGTHADIIALFKGLASSPNIKLCVSSRPWLLFEDSFQSNPSLRLQDLTYNDITRYVEDKLNSHNRMTQLRKIDPENAKGLVDEIVSKASGVFLWVILVVKSLLDGLTNRDRISDLQKRLRLLPSDLHDLYKHMLLKHIDPFYHEQASQIFQIVRAAKNGVYGTPEDLELLTLAFADEEDQDLALNAQVKPLTEEGLCFKATEMTDRLKSRCAGLLEVSGPSSDPLYQKVNYLHRTVQDFLQLPEIWELLLADTSDTFNPDECLVRSYILQLKLVMISTSGDNFEEVSRLVRTALIFGRKAEESGAGFDLRLLDELERSVTCHWKGVPRLPRGLPKQIYGSRSQELNQVDFRKSGNHWANYLYPHRTDQTSQSGFLSLAIEYGLTEYVTTQLHQGKHLCEKKLGRPLLDYIVEAPCPPRADLVLLLLRSGGDPNRKFQGRTMWQHTLGYLVRPLDLDIVSAGMKAKTNRSTPVQEQWRAIFKQLLDAGADLNAVGYWIEKDSIGSPASPSGPKATIWVATPLSIVSPSGPLPIPETEAFLKSLGAKDISFSSSMPMGNSRGEISDALLEVMVENHLLRQRIQINRETNSSRSSWGTDSDARSQTSIAENQTSPTSDHLSHPTTMSDIEEPRPDVPSPASIGECLQDPIKKQNTNSKIESPPWYKRLSRKLK